MTRIIKQEVTREQAGQRWCPWASTAAGNRQTSGEPLAGCLCITTKCMAWVEIDPTRPGFCSLLAQLDQQA